MTITEFLEARIAEDEAAANAYAKVPPLQVFNGSTWVGGYDPARVLAECAAKRCIVNVYCAMAANHPADGSIGWYQVDAYETVLRTLAGVYAGHPDYQEEWAA